MHTKDHCKIGAAAQIPVNSTKPVISVSPVVVPTPDRLTDLEVRVTAPVTGDGLPIVIFSHGQGPGSFLSSLDGYAPLVEFWAAHGFAVIQPTHVSSTHLGLKAPPGEKMYMLRDRMADVPRILDNLRTIGAGVPGLESRLDYSRIAMAGHSGGALTTSLAIGTSNTDPRDGFKLDPHDTRIKAGIIMAGPGAGGSALNDDGKKFLPFLDTDFSTMTTPALVVIGDADDELTVTDRGAAWSADPYHLSPGPKALLTIKGGKHQLCGIETWAGNPSNEESPTRLGIVQRMTWAYLRSQLYDGDTTWADACKALEIPDLAEHAVVESK
ncbi:alpha/beta-hydrolase [Thozetella sp. PMI_491]|nr:alpha/beta-hydrolase [Thozetella sp. PMI_491]